MRLWRLTREDHLALDGEGARLKGGRYSSAGRPVVSLASEPGLAVLVTLRYVLASGADFDQELRLGWTEVAATPERIPEGLAREETIALVDGWLAARRSLLAAIRSAVLPEADVVLLNPLHPDMACVAPLTARRFVFSECLHRPPALEQFGCA